MMASQAVDAWARGAKETLGGAWEGQSRVPSEAMSHCPCQIQENEAQCVSVPVANLRAIEVIPGLVVGVPLMICVPCALHWFCRRLRGKSWGARQRLSSWYSRVGGFQRLEGSCHPIPSESI